MANIVCTVPAGGVRHSAGSGTLTAGANTITHGIALDQIDDPNWMSVFIFCDDPSDVTVGNFTGGPTIPVTNNTGGDVAVQVYCNQIHSAIR